MIVEHSKNAPEHDPTKTGERNKVGHVQHAAVSSAPPRLQGVSLDPSVEIQSLDVIHVLYPMTGVHSFSAWLEVCQ